MEPPNQEKPVCRAFRLAFFQVVSILTTTGYSSVDFENWPAFSQYLLLSLMFIGVGNLYPSGNPVPRVLAQVTRCFFP